jgi:hypothetical protein
MRYAPWSTAGADELAVDQANCRLRWRHACRALIVGNDFLETMRAEAVSHAFVRGQIYT